MSPVAETVYPRVEDAPGGGFRIMKAEGAPMGGRCAGTFSRRETAQAAMECWCFAQPPALARAMEEKP